MLDLTGKNLKRIYPHLNSTDIRRIMKLTDDIEDDSNLLLRTEAINAVLRKKKNYLKGFKPGVLEIVDRSPDAYKGNIANSAALFIDARNASIPTFFFDNYEKNIALMSVQEYVDAYGDEIKIDIVKPRRDFWGDSWSELEQEIFFHIKPWY